MEPVTCFALVFFPQLKPFAGDPALRSPGVKVGWEGALGRDFSFRVCFAPKEMSVLRRQGTKAAEEEYSAKALEGNGNETKRFENLVQTFSDGSPAGQRRWGPPPRLGGEQMSLRFGKCFSDDKNPIVIKYQVQQ